MDDVRVGAAVRAVRRRLGLRQRDVAARAKVSQSCVSRIERGHLESLQLGSIRRVGVVLEMQLQLQQRWRGGELARLLDAEHAALVERVTRELLTLGWEVQPEYTFNHFGERGSVDLVAWHPVRRGFLLMEVKTRIVDVQELLATMARKRRIVPSLLAKERDWSPDVIGQLLVVLDNSTNRRAVALHAATFEATLRARTSAVRRWLRAPEADLAGIAFVASSASRGPSSGSGGAMRVRRKG